MPSTEELDLRGVVLPVSLLKCSRALSQIGSHERLEVLIRDPEAADALVKIIKRSQDRVVQRRKVGDHYRIHIGPISDQGSNGSEGKETQQKQGP